MNTLWQVYFLLPQLQDKADNIYETYLKDRPRLMFQKINTEVRLNGDEKLARRLVDILSTSKVSEMGQGIAYSCLLDVLGTYLLKTRVCLKLKLVFDDYVFV